jgi:hypothetical protein
VIKNKPRTDVKDIEIQQLRAASVNRGKWIYQIVKEGLAVGMQWEDIREAIRKAGAYKGYNSFLRTSDLKKFAKAFATDALIKTNDAEIPVLTDDEFVWEVHYCPLVEAWMQYTDDEEFITKLCDACMEIDRGTMDTYGWNLELKNTIAGGDGKCTICMQKKK